MSLHNWKRDCKLWLVDRDRKPTDRIDSEAEHVSITLEPYGHGAFAFEVDGQSRYASSIKAVTDEEQFVTWQRNERLYSGPIQHISRVLRRQRGAWREKLRIAGRMAGVFLEHPIIQPDSGETWVTFTGEIDDAMKDHVRVQMVLGTAYDDPQSNARGYTGFTVAANDTAHPTSAELKRAGKNLGEELWYWGVDWDVDYDVETTWDVDGITWQFQTYYQGRGSDKTTGNTDGNTPVVLSDIYETVGAADWHMDRYAFRTHAYTRSLDAVAAREGAANFMRREFVADSYGSADASLALADNDQAVGYTFEFVESEGVQAGRDFWLYDKVTYGNERIGGGEYRDDYVAKMRFTYDTDATGTEKIELVLGEPKPSLTKKQRGGKAKPSTPPDVVYIWGLTADDGLTAQPTGEGLITLAGGTAIATTASGDTVTIDSVASGLPYAAPNLTLGTANAAGAADTVMRTDASVLVFDGNNPEAVGTVTAPGSGAIAAYRNHVHAGVVAGDLHAQVHVILDSSDHSDTVTAGVTRGSIIYGNATPKWAELVKGTTDQVLKAGANDISWAQVGHDELTDIAVDDHHDTHTYTETIAQALETYSGLASSSWKTSGAADPDGIDVHLSSGVAKEMIHLTSSSTMTSVAMSNDGGSTTTWVSCTAENAYINSVKHVHYMKTKTSDTGSPEV